MVQGRLVSSYNHYARSCCFECMVSRTTAVDSYLRVFTGTACDRLQYRDVK
jgi:hypothetical protein